jgi:hypothetical protein
VAWPIRAADFTTAMTSRRIWVRDLIVGAQQFHGSGDPEQSWAVLTGRFRLGLEEA